ncbi:ANTAR domain-containing protein [uncultured Jatrophihabitans sp.]|uniref:ANTAR domain-containing protein n=1 Tax=uncultured Jatrophihabitans sp. TaxID=1610747 RepID=UPI0035C965C8
MQDAERDDFVDQLRVRDSEIEGLQAALRASRRIGVAMGILMALHKIDADEAFRRLSTSSPARQPQGPGRRRGRDRDGRAADSGAIAAADDVPVPAPGVSPAGGRR